MNWMAKANFGVSQFDIDPQDFRGDGTRFDILHLCNAQTWKPLKNLRQFV